MNPQTYNEQRANETTSDSHTFPELEAFEFEFVDGRAATATLAAGSGCGACCSSNC